MSRREEFINTLMRAWSGLALPDFPEVVEFSLQQQLFSRSFRKNNLLSRDKLQV